MSRLIFHGDGNDENEGQICFVGCIQDFTLCGMTLDGDTMTAGSFSSTTKKVNCQHCIRIVEHCKSFRRSTYTSKKDSLVFA